MGKYSHQRTAAIGEYKPVRINANATVAPVGIGVSTTAPTAITGAGAVQAITPASMTNIVVGQRLNIAGGTGNPAGEDVTVLSVAGGTFSAAFQTARTGTYNITSVNGTLLGVIVVNKAGDAACVLTLYDGSPNFTGPMKAGTPFAVITNPPLGANLTYNCTCDGGLFYTLTSTTAPELTLTYLDQQTLL